MKTILLSVFALFLSFNSSLFSQSFQYKGVNIEVDNNGNSYAIGNFSSSKAKFGNTILNNSTGSDFFIVKYDNAGKIVWAKDFSNNNESFKELSFGSNNNLILHLTKNENSNTKLSLNKSDISRTISIDNNLGIIKNSNTNFQSSVISKTESNFLTLLFPNGGEDFQVGTNHAIEWTTDLYNDYLKIEYTSDNGITWDSVDVVEAEREEYRCVVPNIISDQNKIRLTSLNNALLTDESDAAFNISGELYWGVNEYENYSLLNSIFFTDEYNGWAAGYDGIINTTDGGETWTEQLQGGFFSVNFLDQNNGWASGFSGTVYKTTNGGIDWNPLNTGITRHLIEIQFVNENYGWAVGDTSIYRTTDGGVTWNASSPTGHILFAISFINTTTGWAAGGEGVLFKTTDGGVNWTQQLSNGTYISVFNSVQFLDENIGWAAGNSLDMFGGIILKTTNGGDDWSLSLGGNDINFIYDINFTDSNTGWTSGESGLIMKSTNGGSSWVQEGSGTLGHINSLFFIDEKNGWNSGDNGLISFYSHNPIPPFIMLANPVELASFSASVNVNTIQLTWVTSSEKNNRGFEILRKESVLGNKESDWVKIGFVEGRGTTSERNSYSFTDNKISNVEYVYRLKQVDYDGRFEYSNEISANLSAPLDFSLNQNYPNPFNPSTKINYNIAAGGLVSLKVYDILGNEIIALVNEVQSPGSYEVDFNATGFSSGTYIYQIIAGNFSATKKMILIK